MEYTNIKLEKENRVATIRLNRPDALNALNPELIAELADAVADVGADGSIKALVIRGEGRAFCAGADLKERRTMSQPQVVQFLNDLRSAFTALERLPIPSIAALDGLAMGGGMELALCADLRVASEGVKGLGLTETKLGIIPG